MTVGIRFRRSTSGAATLEMAVMLAGVIVPAAFGMLMVSQAVWTWAGVVQLTRLGASYAATHCWQDSSGSNVVNYMQAHVPPMIDAQQIISGPAQIQVQYLMQDSANHQSVPFECGNSCSPDCAPDAVTVTVTGYQFASLTRLLGMNPIAMPSFSATMHVESGGGNPDTGESVP